MSAKTLDRDKIWQNFGDSANMSPGELDKWLETDESKAVGWSGDSEGETVGHDSGRRIIEIKQKKKGNLTDDDYAHMRKVVGRPSPSRTGRSEKGS